jgi:hypothetical protein
VDRGGYRRGCLTGLGLIEIQYRMVRLGGWSTLNMCLVKLILPRTDAVAVVSPCGAGEKVCGGYSQTRGELGRKPAAGGPNVTREP